jgi:glycosyltransferase involved in cell wall biosynthesis
VIFATSDWHKDICATVDGPRFITVPLGVDLDIFRCSTENRADPNWTTFLNCGKWEYRKGHDVLVEAFNKAFTKKDRVRLWMLCHNYFLEPNANKGIDGNKEWQSLYKQSPLGDKISFLPRVKFHGNVAKIMQEVDCGVFPSRAEGWNLELLEMMACGKQTIATNYSGHTAFINAHNCYPITIDETEEAYDGKWFLGAEQGYGNWAKLGEDQIDQLVFFMREVHKNKQAGEEMINHPGIETANVYTWDHTVDRILAAF